MSCKVSAVLALCLTAASCTRPAAPAVERIAVLRFENLTGDAAQDWIGRALAEVLARDLSGAPRTYAMAPARLHTLDAAFGKRPLNVPGISAERDLAFASGARRLVYGEYWIRGQYLEARVTLESLPAGKSMPVLVARSEAGDVLGAANRLAAEISARATVYATRHDAALRAYVMGLESVDPAAAATDFEEAIQADPAFGPPYDQLAQIRFRQGDRAGALAVLEQARPHAGAMPALDRAPLAVTQAALRGDAGARQQALAAWAQSDPEDPVVWHGLAESAMAHHEYSEAMRAYQQALSVEPEDPATLNRLGYAAASNGDLNGATQALRRYAALRPGDANPLDSLGDVNLMLGRLREAETFYMQAARLDPHFEGGADWRKAATARLMSGDRGGAESLYQQYLSRRTEDRDPLVEFYRAEWLWMTGRRKDAASRLETFARMSEHGPLQQAASQAYSELAVWGLASGNRASAAAFAANAAKLAGPASAVTAAMAQFLAQPSASEAEWRARAGRAFPREAGQPIRDRALAYALLADRHFSGASDILHKLYDNGASAADDEVPLLLAWTSVETGNPKDAARWLRLNPIPSGSGIHPFAVFSFPRLYYLRGRVAGSPEQAREQFRLFLQLSGDTPLIWGEEANAR